MTQESPARPRPERDAPATAGSKTIPDKRDCGPSVDSWPILDKQGRPIPAEKGGKSSPGRS